MKKTAIILCALVCLLGMTACAGEQADKANAYSVYCLSNSETKVETHEYTVQSDTLEEQVGEMLLVLQTNPASLQYKAPLSMGFQLKDYKVQDGKVILNVNEDYKKLSLTQEVLVRASIVKTLTQLQGINFVSITVNGKNLTDANGKTIGWMNRDQFLENEGSSFNTFETVTLKLYFADEAGTGLMETTRVKEYSSNVSMEKLVVEQLLAGPANEESYPTINPDTKLLSVTVKDGVCYLNFDSAILTPVNNVTSDVMIYSIVNSLVELSNINKVQISIDGQKDTTFKDKYDLTTLFERNLSLLE